MSDFFDKNLFQQIASGTVVLLLSIVLGSKNTSDTPNRKSIDFFSHHMAIFDYLESYGYIGKNN